MLDPDATDYDSDEYKEHVKRQLADKVDPKLHPYRFLREQAYQGIKSKSIIIWNQPFTKSETDSQVIIWSKEELRFLIRKIIQIP